MVKTDSPNFYTRVIYALRWTKQTVRSSTSFQHALRWSKRTLRTSTSLLHALPWSKPALRSSTSLLHSLRWSKLTHQTSSFLQHALRWTKRTLRVSITRFVVVKTDSPTFYSRLGWIPLEQRRRLFRLALVHKCLKSCQYLCKICYQ